jgi:hypothetical protein
VMVESKNKSCGDGLELKTSVLSSLFFKPAYITYVHTFVCLYFIAMVNKKAKKQRIYLIPRSGFLE